MNVRFATAASGNPVHFVLVFPPFSQVYLLSSGWILEISLRRSCDVDHMAMSPRSPGHGLMLLFGYTVARSAIPSARRGRYVLNPAHTDDIEATGGDFER